MIKTGKVLAVIALLLAIAAAFYIAPPAMKNTIGPDHHHADQANIE
jgi:hypothetical protein